MVQEGEQDGAQDEERGGERERVVMFASEALTEDCFSFLILLFVEEII